jgi:hypothetical protein
MVLGPLEAERIVGGRRDELSEWNGGDAFVFRQTNQNALSGLDVSWSVKKLVAIIHSTPRNL